MRCKANAPAPKSGSAANDSRVKRCLNSHACTALLGGCLNFASIPTPPQISRSTKTLIARELAPGLTLIPQLTDRSHCEIAADKGTIVHV